MSGRICVVGIGNGAGKIADGVSDGLASDASVVAINTDAKALTASRATAKLQIGVNRTDGLGTGGDAEVAKLAAEEEVVAIKNLFCDSDIAFIVTCLGGGTGSGAASVVVKAARAAGAITVCFAVLPFKFEGNTQREHADHALAELRGAAHLMIAVPNDRLAELVGDKSVAETFDLINKVVASAIRGIYMMVTKPGFLSLDLADLEKALQSAGGSGTLAYGEATGKDRVQEVLASVLTGSFVEGGRVIADARSLLISIAGGPDLAMKEIGDVFNSIQTKARKGCRLTMGTIIDESLKDKLTVVIVASEEVEVEEKGPAVGAEPEKTTGRKKKSGTHPEQGTLGLAPAEKGRFKGVDPTILDGEDLDIPTYLRRRIKIEK